MDKCGTAAKGNVGGSTAMFGLDVAERIGQVCRCVSGRIGELIRQGTYSILNRVWTISPMHASNSHQITLHYYMYGSVDEKAFTRCLLFVALG